MSEAGDRSPSGGVSRPMFIVGFLAGMGIFALGMWLIPELPLPRWASLLVEALTAGLGLFVTSWIWMKSAISDSVDTSAGDRDRGA